MAKNCFILLNQKFKKMEGKKPKWMKWANENWSHASAVKTLLNVRTNI